MIKGQLVAYSECPPNIEGLQKLCIWSNATIAQYREHESNGMYSCLAEIVDIIDGDEEEGEPTIFKLKAKTNLENFDHEIYAVLSELNVIGTHA